MSTVPREPSRTVAERRPWVAQVLVREMCTASDAATLTESVDSARLDEPVRRYLGHALGEGAERARGARLRMSGRIHVGVWLPFDSVWEGDGRSLSWTAKAGPAALLRVRDQFRHGVGFMDIRVRRRKLMHVENEGAARSAAGRAALESLWVPFSLLPERGVDWRAESDDHIVASFDVPPERPEVHIRIGPDGAVRSHSGLRWHGAKEGYAPFGAEVHAERTFGPVTIPSRFTAGWGYGTADWAPFFEGEIVSLELTS